MAFFHGISCCHVSGGAVASGRRVAVAAVGSGSCNDLGQPAVDRGGTNNTAQQNIEYHIIIMIHDIKVHTKYIILFLSSVKIMDTHIGLAMLLCSIYLSIAHKYHAGSSRIAGKEHHFLGGVLYHR